MTAEIKLLANVLRTEWKVLDAVIEAKFKGGSSDAYYVQFDRFEQAFAALEKAIAEAA